ncbi:hypothetical protein [Xanthomonas sacchari]|uniref:hypothetical protein n=1 Tax=Xanthomonas sacchari TaxID=56458 RepID=UPI002257F681|nr:hypothetical protein [Xanthomonas sacchari]
MDYDFVDRQGGEFDGIALSASPAEEGAQADEMIAGDSVLVFRFFEYRGWAHLVAAIQRRVATLLPFLDQRDMEMRSIGIEIQDIFISDESSGPYVLGDVFLDGSPYVAPALSRFPSIWETRHDWASKSEELDLDLLDVLKLGVSPVKSELISADGVKEIGLCLQTEVTHRTHCFAKQPGPEFAERMTEILENLHMRNKQVVLEVINVDMAKRIGLKD